MTVVVEGPVGIGPVLAGWQDRRPVYFYEILYEDGGLRRLVWEKAGEGADRSARNAAVHDRIGLARRHRPGVVLIHDEASFNALVMLVRRLAGRQA